MKSDDDKGMASSNKTAFEEIAAIIERSRERVFRSVNRELIDMYWKIGQYISEKAKTDKWGKSIVKEFADFIQTHYVAIQGFSASNIWRMRQFYETYAENEKLAPLVREIGWAQNLIIMSRAKTDEAREFYLLLSTKNNYSKRELERQIDSALFERTMISHKQNQLVTRRSPGLVALRDSYVLEFLDIPEQHREKELRKAIIANLRDFILEFGKNFGYRVKSLRDTQFRRWALEVLKEYLRKGFAMNGDLLKKAGGGDYWREPLNRIRDIRSSERVF